MHPECETPGPASADPLLPPRFCHPAPAGKEEALGPRGMVLSSITLPASCGAQHHRGQAGLVGLSGLHRATWCPAPVFAPRITSPKTMLSIMIHLAS